MEVRTTYLKSFCQSHQCCSLCSLLKQDLPYRVKPPYWGDLNRVERNEHKITWLQVLNIVPYTQIQMYNHDVIVTSANMAPIIRKKRVQSVTLSIFTYLVGDHHVGELQHLGGTRDHFFLNSTFKYSLMCLIHLSSGDSYSLNMHTLLIKRFTKCTEWTVLKTFTCYIYSLVTTSLIRPS